MLSSSAALGRFISGMAEINGPEDHASSIGLKLLLPLRTGDLGQSILNKVTTGS